MKWIPKNPHDVQHFINVNLFEDDNYDIDEVQRDATMCVLRIVAPKIFTSRVLKLIKD